MCAVIFIAFIVVFANIEALRAHKKHPVTKVLAIILAILLILFNTFYLMSYFLIPTHHGHHYTKTNADIDDWQFWQNIEDQVFQDSEDEGKIIVRKNVRIRR